MRHCSYTFDNEDSLSDTFEVIQNGCSANEPTTVLSEFRNTIEHDKFGQVMFMHADPKNTKVSISCTVDACLPPSFGVFSCDVESACAGRYEDIYEYFGAENEVLSRRRRRDTAVSEELIQFDIYHPCHLINKGEKETVCSEDRSKSCWTKELCETRTLSEIISKSSATTLASTAIALFFATFL